MVKDIDIAFIRPHPENSNRMDAETLSKLRRHIERTGRYEPLVVRPHSTEQDRFQVINGHHRLQVLKTLGQTKAKCVVWEVDDEQTRLYLATLNRLSGEDLPERRAFLVGSLLENFDLNELASLLPEDREQLAELEQLAKIETEVPATCSKDQEENIPYVILDFFLDPEQAKEVNLALELIARRYSNAVARSDALVQLARQHLDSTPSVMSIPDEIGDSSREDQRTDP